ncbi:MAG: UDP-glucose 4-epimerase GalE [Alphaproteobacteria bacterium]|nr:UDP-glucose 4-epimerase GalE [Alphaproteobacteria bacterium]
MKILVTGGAGYIGSHTCVELAAVGHDIVVLDNFSNSHPESINRVAQLVRQKITLVKAELRHAAELAAIFATHHPDAVIHFAGLKAVGESNQKPLIYYENNVVGTVNLLQAMQNAGCKSLVFSSSATVYGAPQKLPLTEDHPLSATNPYGRSKLMIEEILRDLYRSDPSWRLVILRYFNPVGAHESGLIGEDPQGIPNNLMPFVAQVAGGRRDKLSIWGNDYPTIDGTGVRDYIHVVDLAVGHVCALDKISQSPQGNCFAVNLGTGTGYSVLQVIDNFKRASNRDIPYEFCPRRAGDVAEVVASPDFARQLLGWQARRGLDEMCRDHWRWQASNPNGFAR